MLITELLQSAQFVVDAGGNKKAVVLDYTIWEELLTLLEDLEDIEEMNHLRKVGEETIPWERAKLELRAKGIRKEGGKVIWHKLVFMRWSVQQCKRLPLNENG